MSLVRLALRFITVKALHNATWADDRIVDSTMRDLTDALADNPQPTLLVFTDESMDEPEGKELVGGQGTTQLAIIASISGAVRVEEKGEDGLDHVVYQFPETDDATALALDVLERQVRTALGDPRNPWADLWRQFVTNIIKVRSDWGGSSKEGTRYGARQILFDLGTVYDPVPGAPVEGAWKNLLDALAADEDEESRQFGLLLKSLCEGTPLVPWERAAAQMGWSRDVVDGVGIGPFRRHPLDPHADAAPLTEVEIDPRVTTSEPILP